jgi:ABC-2 type transport system ATP-binding protein
VREVLLELKARGAAVLLNSHLLGEVEQVCDRVAIVDKGLLIREGSPADLAAQRGVEVETANGVRRFPDARRDDVPTLVTELVAAGERIYGVRVLTSTLEETYLQSVEGLPS